MAELFAFTSIKQPVKAAPGSCPLCFLRFIYMFGLWLLLSNSMAGMAQDVLVGQNPEGGAFGGGTVFSIKTTGAGFTVHRKLIKAGVIPYGDLVKGTDGNFYGMNSSGSVHDISTTGYGTIFKMTPTGTIVGLKDLDYTITGGNPLGSLVQGTDGNFYGMTSNGGTHNFGTIFKMTASGSLTVLKHLDNKSGSNPSGNLIQGTDGNFYGMTAAGGTYSSGTIFKLTPTGTYTVLKHLNGSITGTYPGGSLLQNSDGNFYGMTNSGGADGSGTIFKLTPTGTFTVVKHFNYFVSGGNPKGSLVKAIDGNFYGMTYGGGANGYGTIFKITSSGALTVIKHLDNLSTGTGASGSLVQGIDGNFYGMTSVGGANNYGTIFKCTPAGELTILRHLNFATDGAYPYGSLYRNSDGYFYGMTSAGGTSFEYAGTVFKISTTGTYSVLMRLPDGALGFNPTEALVQAKDGFYYGMAHNGGRDNYGTVFRTCTNGVLTALRHFDYYKTGGYPDGGLVQGTDGNFYGIATGGGTNIHGTIFKMTPAGILTVLKQLNEATTGGFPYGRLVQGNDGNFYGIANSGGTGSYGTIFKITPTGAFTVLKQLTSSTGGRAIGSLTLGNDGNFYGMTTWGGTSDVGTIFRITPAGVFTVLKHLDYYNMGANPWGSLVKGKDGNFYGMTTFGGLNFEGTIFKITAGGVFTVLKQLDTLTTGAKPRGELVQGNDGILYGMTSEGGIYDAGTIFKITTSGTLTVLRHLNYDTDGGYPTGNLVIQKPNPVANPLTVSTAQNTPKKIKLNGSGGTPLTYAVATAPKNGTAKIVKDSLTYTPKTGYAGADSINITATWGCQKSTPAKIKITVTASLLAATGSNNTTITGKEENATGNGLMAHAWPNPSGTYFTIVIQSNSHEPLTIRVLDGLGRTVEVRNTLAAGGSIRLGENYKNGFYYAVVIQGSEKANLKLVKVAQ